ncbi:aldehyde:ferredoxin oxidoreductase [Syntrophus gentianae]|uniref:Aldehyde:ferredoxin oxidoreductase n=1 Tax=Syntrophus gentianae TaxID=43775 RepID=A0A1H7Y7P7_9BACT|nr:aldehyde ferredoxin oxidoreductase C-terminal domain-containing protein [Syntrophus gentianae]SEM41219.1 aldehyde:ferredoxin oxidoreductase [Syntrophus gentianae]
MNGWQGKILKIDLSSGKWEVECPEPELYVRWIGGRGLAGSYLWDQATRSWDDPEMPLLFFTGPLVDTASPTSGMMTVMSRSPLTGTVGDGTVGGSLGTALKKAGWDGLVITGRAKTLCAVEIEDARITLVDAASLSGRRTSEVYPRLKEKGAVALAGPTAEAGVRFASIVVDGSYPAVRNGLGLLFTAKNLKYLTVRGSGKTEVADPEALKRAAEDVQRLLAASPFLLGDLGIGQYGTAALYDLVAARRMLPTENFRRTHFDAARQMNAHAFRKRYAPRRTGCLGCSILCKRIATDGRSLPEFEALAHFSALLENTDLETVMEANRLCAELGMDPISAAATLACHGEIRGRTLEPPEILSLLQDIGTGRGVGQVLGQGAALYAQSCGKPETAMTVKGMELPGYDPRGAYGMALAYATSTRGGCTFRAYPIGSEILRKPVATDRFTFSGKARMIKGAEDLFAVADSLTACPFVFLAASLEEYARIYTAVTGIETSADDLLTAGERIDYSERIMNFRNGFQGTDDDLPARFFKEPGTGDGHLEIPPLDRDEFLKARALYRRIRGLDEEGRPTREKAAELGIAWNGEIEG